MASTALDWNPRFSPDGERVAFTSARSGSLEIWVADADGGRLLRLTSLGKDGTPGRSALVSRRREPRLRVRQRKVQPTGTSTSSAPQAGHRDA